MNMNLFVKVSLNMLMKTKMNLFYKHEHKEKLNFFSHNKIKFQPRI